VDGHHGTENELQMRADLRLSLGDPDIMPRGDFMKTVSTARESSRGAQFRLWSLFEFVTVCAVVSALSAVIGAGASVCLMLMALFLWAKRGLIALAMLMAASLMADWSGDPLQGAVPLVRQFAVIVLATALCSWYALRRKYIGAKSPERQ